MNNLGINSLVYQPLYRSVFENNNVEPSTRNIFTYNDYNVPFPVEPVMTDNLADVKGNTYNNTIYPNSYVERPIEYSNFEVTPVTFNYPQPIWKSSNYVELPKEDVNGFASGEGKVYKSSERNNFVKDFYNAYVAVLMNKGFDRNKADAYAKYLVAQDSVESNWGQSNLSKYFNFGGVKDFRKDSNAIVLETKEHENGKDVIKKQPFRRFKDLLDYANYKIELLGNSNYNVFAYAPEELYHRLITAPKKYATAKNYEYVLNSRYNHIWGSGRYKV